MRIQHLPTWLLIIGYPLFWAQLFLKPSAHTCPVASLLFVTVSAVALYRFSNTFSFKTLPQSPGTLIWSIPITYIALVGLMAALLPLHLTQEADAMNYHYALPRQHLILGSFIHIPWSAADLWLMPIQDALAPFWFVTPLPNKVPQFIFLMGLLAVMWSLVRCQTASRWACLGAVAAFIGSHGVSIQLGTGMLDIPIVYLALAGIDSLLAGETFFAAIELAFFMWSKSFMPIEGLAIALTGIVPLVLDRRGQYILQLGFSDIEERWAPIDWKTFGKMFGLLSIIVAGPFILKSLYYVGTPLFPFGVFALGGTLAHGALSLPVINAAHVQLGIRDAYGEGRSLWSFVAHIWRVAVPSHGVNNAFDYPLGLPWLLLTAPFLFLSVSSVRRHRLPLLPGLAILLWGLWWVGSQQSRWLYLPLALMIVTTLAHPQFTRNWPLRAGLWIALVLTSISVTRANRLDLAHWPNASLRPKDSLLLQESQHWSEPQPMPVEDKEVAYAEVPVRVLKGEADWILPTP